MDNNDMYQSEQPTGTEPDNNQFANNNGNYQQYPYNNYNYNGNYQVPYQQDSPLDLEEPVKMSEWLISLLITLFIPCIGLIMTFVWAFGNTEKKSKSNFFKALLVCKLIGFIFFLVYVFCLAAYSATYGVNF